MTPRRGVAGEAALSLVVVVLGTVLAVFVAQRDSFSPVCERVTRGRSPRRTILALRTLRSNFRANRFVHRSRRRSFTVTPSGLASGFDNAPLHALSNSATSNGVLIFAL